VYMGSILICFGSHNGAVAGLSCFNVAMLSSIRWYPLLCQNMHKFIMRFFSCVNERLSKEYVKTIGYIIFEILQSTLGDLKPKWLLVETGAENASGVSCVV
jgi:hypothetical protein